MGLFQRIFESLNAPFGARCFLTDVQMLESRKVTTVLMHRLALGAF